MECGGYNGGEIASKLAVITAKSYIETNFKQAISEMQENEQTDEKEIILKLIKSASIYANMVVYEKAQTNERINKMGTTLDICLVYHQKMFISHVGDSRVYRLRKQYLRKLTKDHSYVQTLIDEGKITKEQAIVHPKKNMLMKAIGTANYIEPDVFVKGFLKGDKILMCSDGLTNMVSEEEIKNVMMNCQTDGSKLLVQMANDNGGKDNVTAIIITSE